MDGELKVARRKSVAWFNVRVLWRSLQHVLLAVLFARFADKRETEHVIDADVLDLSHDQECWVDYVADVGDGFDATTTVAHLLARDHLRVDEPGDGRDTRRGSLLVMGGDEVYPYADIEEYQIRTVGPYRAVFPQSRHPHPQLVAIPGNHDWYDGLTAFMRVFAAPGVDGPDSDSWIGGWQTPQRRSYFAVELPHRWWLWGIDIQLEAYVDSAQIEWFQAAAEKMGEGDGLILCCAKPSWLEESHHEHAYEVLDFFVRKIVPDDVHVRLMLAGDQHCYVRYESKAGDQRVMAGGGGGYLSATHHFPDAIALPDPSTGIPVCFDIARPSPDAVRDVRYPDAGASLTEGDRAWWRVPARNGTLFSLLVGSLYGVLSALVPRSRRAPREIVGFAAGTAGLFGILLGFTRARHAKAALLHTAMHVPLLAFATGRLRHRFPRSSTALAVGALGTTVGPAIVGSYLSLADGRWEVNSNELFAAQRVDRYKCFVRLQIEAGGDLVLRTIGIDDPCRTWIDRTQGEVSERDRRPLVEPGEEIRYRLVDGPVRISRTPAGPTSTLVQGRNHSHSG